MKINKISVEGFGKLKNKTLNFSKGINVIKGENESGKSTIAKFIRFMLYGFTSRNTDISKNDKKRYSPWDGSACKGEMEVSLESGEYIIRREQTARASHSITDMSGVSVHKGENAGDAFLGVNEDTYDKTALITAGDVYFDDAISLSLAIKNIVFSADSDVDSDEALKKLEELRKKILGKNERTGRLFTARKELQELAERKNELAEAHRELLSAEYNLEKTLEKIKTNDESIKKLQKEKHNIEAHDASVLVGKAEALRQKAKESRNLYENSVASITIDGFFPDKEYLTSLNEAVLDLERSKLEVEDALRAVRRCEDGLSRSYSDVKQFTFNNRLGEMGKTPAQLMEDISVIKSAIRSKKTFAILFTALLITIPVAIVFWVGYSRLNKELLNLCTGFDCGDISELEALVKNSEASEAEVKNAKNMLDDAKSKLDKAYDIKATRTDTLCRLLEKTDVCFSLDDTEQLTHKANDHIKTLSVNVSSCEELEKQMNIDEIAYESFVAAIDDYEGVKKLAEEYDEAIPLRDIKVNAKELDFYTRANIALGEKSRDYEKKSAIITSNIDKPDELEGKIVALSAEIKQLEEKHSALVMAQQAISKAHESMRDNVSPVLTGKASELFRKMTAGKYKGLYVDNELKLSFLEEGGAEYRSVDYLSSGAADAAYLALRITLTEYLYKEKPTLIFDDAFSRLDDIRLERVCDMLKTLSEEYQIIILTCHDREVKMLSGNKHIDF